MDWWETHVAVIDASQIRGIIEGEPLTVEGEWYTRSEYEAHDHGDTWDVVASITFQMDEYGNISVLAAPVETAGVGYRILD